MTSPGRQYGLPWRGAEVARTAGAAGVTAFCSGEFVDHEAYSTLAEMALHTERALVGPGIAYAFARTPYAHAAGIRGAWRHAPGRVFLGLGSGAYKINRTGSASPPTGRSRGWPTWSAPSAPGCRRRTGSASAMTGSSTGSTPRSARRCSAASTRRSCSARSTG